MCKAEVETSGVQTYAVKVNGITVRSTLHETQGEFSSDLPAYEYLDLGSTLEEGGLRKSFDVFLPADPILLGRFFLLGVHPAHLEPEGGDVA